MSGKNRKGRQVASRGRGGRRSSGNQSSVHMEVESLSRGLPVSQEAAKAQGETAAKKRKTLEEDLREEEKARVAQGKERANDQDNFNDNDSATAYGPLGADRIDGADQGKRLRGTVSFGATPSDGVGGAVSATDSGGDAARGGTDLSGAGNAALVGGGKASEAVGTAREGARFALQLGRGSEPRAHMATRASKDARTRAAGNVERVPHSAGLVLGTTSPNSPSGDRVKLKIVDREAELVTLVSHFGGWHDLFPEKGSPTQKPHLLFTNQMFGAGKSVFGENAVELLNRKEMRNVLLSKLDSKVAVAALDRFANAGTVTLVLEEEAPLFRRMNLDFDASVDLPWQGRRRTPRFFACKTEICPNERAFRGEHRRNSSRDAFQ